MHAIHLDGAAAAAPHHARRPTSIELAAAALLAAAVVLHVVAMLPTYYGGAGQSSLWSQPEQAVLFAVLAGGWAVALALGLSSPARVATSAAFAVGLAGAELGFRVTDLGTVFSGDGGTSGGAGVYLMTAAWVVGAIAAGTAVLAVHRQRQGTEDAWTTPATVPDPVGPEVAALPGPAPETAQLAAADDPPTVGFASPTVELGTTTPHPEWSTTLAAPADTDATAALDAGASSVEAPEAPEASKAPEASEAVAGADRSGDTTVLPAAPRDKYRPAPLPLVLVGLLSLATAGAFLPAWDHYTGIATDPSTGQTASVSLSLGNAFHYPWQMIVGNVLAAIAIAVIPIAAYYFLRNKALVAATIAGVLLVLSAQFASAIDQASRAVPASFAGPDTVLHLSLTGWFTLDVLVAYALFAVGMVLGHLRVEEGHESSDGMLPSTPEARRVASLPWS